MNKQNSKYRWVVFAAVMLTYLLMASQRTAPGLITDQVMRDFKVTASTIGLLTSIQFLVYTGLQIPMGLLADRFGPNYLLVIGATLTGIGTVIYSLGTNEFALFFARMLIGLGDATIWVNLVLVLSHWFHAKEFVRLIGLAGMVGSLGFLLATVPFSTLIDFVGWRNAFLTAGVLLCLCGLFLYIILLKNPKKMFQDAFEVEENKVEREKTTVLLRKIICSRQAWSLFLCHFGVVGAYVGFISSWAVPYGMDMYGMTRSNASQLIMIGLIGALIGAPVTSWISSHFGTVKRPYVVVQITIFLSWFGFLIFKGYPPQYLLFILFFIIGYGYGASTLTFAAVRQTFPISESGLVSGFANTGGFLSAVLLPFIFGNILDYFQAISGNVEDSYSYSFIIPALFSIIGIIGACWFRENHQNIDGEKQSV